MQPALGDDSTLQGNYPRWGLRQHNPRTGDGKANSLKLHIGVLPAVAFTEEESKTCSDGRWDDAVRRRMLKESAVCARRPPGVPN